MRSANIRADLGRGCGSGFVLATCCLIILYWLLVIGDGHGVKTIKELADSE